MHKILAINPGSTSTKIAVYQDQKRLYTKSIEHSKDQLEKYERVIDQFDMRKAEILDFLREENFDINELSAVVGRGGLLPPVQSGAYRVNKKMVERLRYNPVVEHASNLGAIISDSICSDLGIPAFIYDSVAVDEMQEIARISGMADIPRKCFSHALNMRSVGMKVAQKYGENYHGKNYVIVHLGGGISVSMHSNGKIIDTLPDDQGPFSPERSGKVPCADLVELCYKEDRKTVKKKMRGQGGLVSYLGTNSAIEVEERIQAGDEHAKLIYQAMAYQIAKGIGEMATVVDGQVDRIIITGGIAYSKMMMGWVQKKVEFIAPVEIVPGENELESLAFGALRVLKGEETAHEYDVD